MNKRIEHYKELLQVLPRNNVKNSKIYLEKATFMKNVAVEYKNELVNEIKKRYVSLLLTRENEELKILENYLGDKKEYLYLLDNNESYEKSSLDESLHDIQKFYKNDLVKVNQDISITIKKFNLVGIILEPSDFTYGKETVEYMTAFLKENNPESNLLKELFDKLYWKNPGLIENIYLNFRYLYFKFKKKFDKYYDNKKENINLNLENYMTEYKKYLYIKNTDMKILQDRILNGELDVKEYEDSKIEKLKESLLLKRTSPEVDNENIIKLSYTLQEYKNYLRFKSIIEEIKLIYEDKSNKNITKGILKNIAKCEKKIKKANRKFFKLKEEKKNVIINSNIVELKNYYKEYDEAKFKEKVATSLNDNSTLLDILKLINSYKINLIVILKKNNEEITDQEIDLEEKALKEFIFNPNNTFINNITIKDTRDVVTIILDKYKLMNINLTNEQLEDTNLDNFITTVNKIMISNTINNSSLKFEDLNNLCEMKKILDKENVEI